MLLGDDGNSSFLTSVWLLTSHILTGEETELLRQQLMSGCTQEARHSIQQFFQGFYVMFQEHSHGKSENVVVYFF